MSATEKIMKISFERGDPSLPVTLCCFPTPEADPVQIACDPNTGSLVVTYNADVVTESGDEFQQTVLLNGEISRLTEAQRKMPSGVTLLREASRKQGSGKEFFLWLAVGLDLPQGEWVYVWPSGRNRLAAFVTARLSGHLPMNGWQVCDEPEERGLMHLGMPSQSGATNGHLEGLRTMETAAAFLNSGADIREIERPIERINKIAVLLVGSDSTHRNAQEQALREGARLSRLCKADNVTAALDLMAAAMFDAVFVPLGLAGSDNFEFLRQVRANNTWRETRVILLGDAAKRQLELRQLGASGFLPTDFSASTVKAQLVYNCLQ